MPTYDYVCEACGHEFEHFQAMSDKHLRTCPKCKKKKLVRNLDGIRRMHRLPQALLIIDPRREVSSLAEAHKMGIPAVCIIDTDADPDRVDIAIPANDDAYRSVQIVLGKLADSVSKGREKLDIQRGAVTKLAPTDAQVPVATGAEPAGEPTA